MLEGTHTALKFFFDQKVLDIIEYLLYIPTKALNPMLGFLPLAIVALI